MPNFVHEEDHVRVWLLETGLPSPFNIRGRLPLRNRLPCKLLKFLGPHGRIGQGYITGIFGKEYTVAHSGTQIPSLSKEYISPTIKTRKSFALKSTLCPVLNTIKCKTNLKVRFKLGTKGAKSHRK